MALVARRSGRRRRLMADINVVPYVDVMLVLVVILMVAAPFVNPGVVKLPIVEKAGPQEGLPLRVIVRSNGAISLLETGGRETSVSKAQLASAVQARLASAATPVVIEGDSKVAYEAVVGVMNILKNAGIERVGLMVAR
ncbi:MAG: biopolymer transporter ExbD [Burkholderiaceae bacterium]